MKLVSTVKKELQKVKRAEDVKRLWAPTSLSLLETNQRSGSSRSVGTFKVCLGLLQIQPLGVKIILYHSADCSVQCLARRRFLKSSFYFHNNTRKNNDLFEVIVLYKYNFLETISCKET